VALETGMALLHKHGRFVLVKVPILQESDADQSAGTACCTKAKKSWMARNGSFEVIFACEGELL